MPLSLTTTTVRAAILFAAGTRAAAVGALSAGAATLARGALNAMILKKLTVLSAVGLMTAGLAGGGAVVVAQQGDRPGGTDSAAKGQPDSSQPLLQPGSIEPSASPRAAAPIEKEKFGSILGIDGKRIVISLGRLDGVESPHGLRHLPQACDDE